MLHNLNMFPELVKAQCTIMGAWGPAIANLTGLNLMQIRALDFGLDTPLNSFPLLSIYHPNAGNGHTFAVLGWTGVIGAVTAYSNIMGVSEKVWDGFTGERSSIGIPFNFLLRDIAQFDKTVDDSLNRIYNATRTCAIWIGLGSNYTNELRLVNYATKEVMVWDDENFPAYPPVHPLLEGVVFVDRHVQPSGDPCMGANVVNNYGNLGPETAIQTIIALSQTGDLHAAVYDFGHNYMYVSIAGVPILSNGQPVYNGTVWPAYERPWFQFDMNELFAVTQ